MSTANLDDTGDITDPGRGRPWPSVRKLREWTPATVLLAALLWICSVGLAVSDVVWSPMPDTLVSVMAVAAGTVTLAALAFRLTGALLREVRRLRVALGMDTPPNEVLAEVFRLARRDEGRRLDRP